MKLLLDQQVAELFLSHLSDEEIVETLSELLKHFMNGLELEHLDFEMGEL